METAQQSLLESMTILSPLVTISDKKLPIYDPVKKTSIESMVLHSWKQWTLLVFYPADFTFVCPTELAKLHELYGKFLAENTEVLVISRDSIFAHEKWIETDSKLQWFSIKMVSDRDGVLWKDMWLIHSKTGEYERASLIVAPTWQIAYIEVAPSKIWRNIDELLRKVQALNHLMLHPENVCQEWWQPGKDAIVVNKTEKKKQFTHNP